MTAFTRGENPLRADKLNQAFSERVLRAGDMMVGPLTLARDPEAPFEAATKQYVDRFTAEGVPTGAYIGAAPPGNVIAPLWWDTNSGQLYIQYNDGSSTQWVVANSLGGTGAFLPLTGGTVTGPTTFNGPLTGTAFGTAPNLVPRFTDTGSGFPMLALTNRVVIRRASPAAGDFTSLQLDRTSTFSGGNASQRNSLINLSETVAAGDATVNNPLISTITTNGNANGQAIAGLFQVTRNPGSTDFVWAMITDAIDKTGLGTAASGAHNLLAQEVDLEANGPDDGVNVMTYGGKGVRRGMHFSAMRYDINNTAQTEFSCALSFSTNNLSPGYPIDAFTNWQSIIGFSPNTQVRNVVDSRGAITPAGSSTPVSAVTMTAGHVIDFNGGPQLDSAIGNSLSYTTVGGNRLRYMVTTSERFAITDAGMLILGQLPTNAANDAAAASAGVPIGGVYRNGSALMIRTI